MLSQKMIELLTNKSDMIDEVVFYCNEHFRFVDLEDKSFQTDSGDTTFEDALDEDFTFYTATELSIEDDIFEFIKDYKKVLKSVQNFEQFPKKLVLFMSSEELILSEECVEEYASLQHIEDYSHSLSLWELTLNKKPKIEI